MLIVEWKRVAEISRQDAPTTVWGGTALSPISYRLFHLQIYEHGGFERLPGGFGGGSTADGTLDDAGEFGAVAVQRAVETDTAEIGERFAAEAGAGIGIIESCDPDGAERMDERREQRRGKFQVRSGNNREGIVSGFRSGGHLGR